MEIAEWLASLATKVRQQKATIQTEEATKNAFVMPFISLVLGYDVFNPNEVVPEFTADVGTKKGEKIDVSKRNLIAVRTILREDGFKSSLAWNRKGYLFTIGNGEMTRIMRRNGEWDLRASNRNGNSLDRHGNAGGNPATHGIRMFSR